MPALENKLVDDSFFDKFEIQDLDPVALLYQTGYLTIKFVEAEGDEEWFTLGYPNYEVRNSLLKNLYVEYAVKQTKAILKNSEAGESGFSCLASASTLTNETSGIGWWKL